MGGLRAQRIARSRSTTFRASRARATVQENEGKFWVPWTPKTIPWTFSARSAEKKFALFSASVGVWRHSVCLRDAWCCENDGAQRYFFVCGVLPWILMFWIVHGILSLVQLHSFARLALASRTPRCRLALVQISSPSTASSLKPTAGMWPCMAWSIRSAGLAVMAQNAVPRHVGAPGGAGVLGAAITALPHASASAVWVCCWPRRAPFFSTS